MSAKAWRQRRLKRHLRVMKEYCRRLDEHFGPLTRWIYSDHLQRRIPLISAEAPQAPKLGMYAEVRHTPKPEGAS